MTDDELGGCSRRTRVQERVISSRKIANLISTCCKPPQTPSFVGKFAWKGGRLKWIKLRLGAERNLNLRGAGARIGGPFLQPAHKGSNLKNLQLGVFKSNSIWHGTGRHQIKSLLLGCLQLLYPTHAYGANFCNDLSRTFYKLPNTFICVDNIQISLKMGDVAWPKTFLCGQCSQYPEVHFTPQSPNAGNVRYLWKEICVNK